jgi:hypothetical protein|tara:strand:- start:8 stop:190 length:183 start_codon:yes stop_codon:yes gene_type:complete
METNLSEMYPWADIHRMLSNMRSLTIDADGKKHTGKASITIDDHGGVTVKVGKTASTKKK